MQFGELNELGALRFLEEVDVLQSEYRNQGNSHHHKVKVVPRILEVSVHSEPNDLEDNIKNIDSIEKQV